MPLNKVTSAECGTLTTACYIASVAGTYLSAVLIFPRRHLKAHMINGASPGTLGLADPSGWMTAELFRNVIEGFIKHSNSFMENPSVLIYNNHEGHFDPTALRVSSRGVHVVNNLTSLQ